MDSLKFRPPASLRLSSKLWQQMQVEVKRLAPEEACGLLAGRGEEAWLVIPITNVLHSPVRYRMDPEEQLNAFLHIEKEDLELLGIYHSHPGGPAVPSPTDIAEAYYPEAVYLIWSHASGRWQCRGFSIQQNETREISILTTNEE